MKLKKLFAGILAVAMMATMAAPAFATEAGAASEVVPEVDKSTVSVSNGPVTEVELTKTYEVNNGTTQAETFTYTLDGASVSNSSVKTVPAIDATATSYSTHFDAISATSTDTFKIDLSKLNIARTGVYTYTITEAKGSTPGVTYDEAAVTMKVTATNSETETGALVYHVALYKNGKKINAADAFKNVYNAYKLSITKTVKGNFGDHSKYFAFTVKLTGTAGKTYAPLTAALETADAANESVLTTIAVDGQAHTFYLKHNQTLNIMNLPDDVAYVVEETDEEKDQYTVTPTNTTGNMTQDQAASVENKREGTVDTGVILDNAPYIALMMVVVAGAAVMIIKKRRHFED